MAGEWPIIRLGDYVDSSLGKMLDAQKNKGQLQPYLGNSNVRWGTFDLADLAQMKFEEHEEERYGIRDGDLIVCEGGEPGRCAVWREEIPNMKIQKALHRIRTKDGLNNYYLFYWFMLTGRTGRLEPHFTGTTIKHLTGKAVSALELPLPPIEVQEEIARVLKSLDDKIELNRRMNETLEAIARAIFRSWFVDFDPVRAKASGEPPESICRRLGLTPELLALFPDRLVDSELGEIPEGWEMKAIEDVAKVVKGKSYKSSELAPSKTALVTLKSFKRGGGYRLDGLKEYTGSYKSEQEVFGGDLVVAYTDVTQAADVIGKPALVISDDAYDHLVISLDVAVVRPVRDEYRIYLYGVMSGAEFQQHTRAHTTGTTVLHLASNAVPGFKFIFPGEALVDAYANIAAPMFASIDERIAEGRTLGALRDTLLPKLLSGALRVPVTGDL